jgi:cytochrome b6-f complex iron-sulfur subunit
MEGEGKNPQSDSKGMTRRDLLVSAGWGALLISMASAAAGMFRFLSPNVLFEGPTKVKIGQPGDYSPGTVTFLEENRLFILRDGKGFRALSAVCTHLGCTVNKDAGSNSYSCPCHGSKFDADGNVTHGPAPQAMRTLEIALTPSGRMVVDLDRTVPRDHYFKA